MSLLKDVLREVKETLEKNPQLVERGVVGAEAEQIIRAALESKKTRLEIFSQMNEAVVSEAAEKKALDIAQKRARGVPLQHLTGVQVFLDHEYAVGPEVLIPRPETEVLVSHVMDRLSLLGDQELMGFEVGLGSGVISVELLAHFQNLTMLATEVSQAAIVRAEKNSLKILGITPSEFKRFRILHVKSDEVLEPFMNFGKAYFIVSNPPYLSKDDPIDEEVLKHEPYAALFAGTNPLYFYEKLASQAPGLLRRGGFVFLEIPPERSEKIHKLFSESIWDARVLKDLNSRDRILSAELK